MTFYPTDRIALFIDGANLYAASKALAFDIDYKKLLEEFRKRGVLVRAPTTTRPSLEDQEYSPLRPLVDWLDYNGFTMVTKAAKRFTDAAGVVRTKGNMDIEIAVDMMQLCQPRRPHGAVLGRRRFPATDRGGAEPRRVGDGGLHGQVPAAHGLRRPAATRRTPSSTSRTCPPSSAAPRQSPCTPRFLHDMPDAVADRIVSRMTRPDPPAAPNIDPTGRSRRGIARSARAWSPIGTSTATPTPTGSTGPPPPSAIRRRGCWWRGSRPAARAPTGPGGPSPGISPASCSTTP